MASKDFDESYCCVECGQAGHPDTGAHAGDDYSDGFFVRCGGCGFMIAGPSKPCVLQALSVLAGWRARVKEIAG